MVKTLPDTVVTFDAAISAPLNAPKNTIIATKTVAINGATPGTAFGNCSNGTSNFYWQIAQGQNTANRVGSTSVPGIGYTASVSGGMLNSPITLDKTLTANLGGKFNTQMYLTVNLVATGTPIGSGKLSLNPSGPGVADRVGLFFAGDGSLTSSLLFRAMVAGNVTTITSAGCSVTTPSTTVTMRSANASAFTGIGSTTGDTPVSLGLTCPSAVPKVLITLTDNVSPTNVSNILSTKTDSTSSGVKLQILDQAGKPVMFGPDSSLAGNTNQWLVGQATPGLMNIPLTVRYIQTAQTIKPGTVNGVATFTMSYQ